MDKEGALYPMLESKAVMTRIQLMQMAGMKGLVSNPAGEIIELPVKNSYKEGLNTLQYFISANNNDRDTALKYYIKARNLERRLLHAAQDLIISEEDCGDKQGIEVWRRDGTGFGLSFAARLLSRPTVEDVIDPATGMVLARKGEIIDKKTGRFIEREERIEKVSVRSPMTCRSLQGVCQSCYGYDLGNNHIIRIGEAAGVVAAQAVGLAVIRMATKIFHRGETMGDNDIPRYFHRIDEIFEIREVEDKAVISEIQGIVENISDKGKQQIIRIRELSDIMYSRKPSASADRYVEYTIPQNSAVWVEEGQKILAGTQLCQGDTDINDLFRVSGARATERYIINELQNVFASQGLHVHDKHLEMITRQMFSRVHVRESGGSQLVPGEIMERNRFIEINNDLLAYKKTPAKAAQLIMGITPVVLSSASFLRAASFWHPLKTLFNAACAGKEDKLLGLTENIIIGRLIPAGTGYRSNLMRASKIAGKEIDGITEELSLEDF